MKALGDVFCVEKWIRGKSQPCKELAGNLSRKRKPRVAQPRDTNELGCLRNRKRHMWLEAWNESQTIGHVVWEGWQMMWGLGIFILCCVRWKGMGEFEGGGDMVSSSHLEI